MYFNLITESIIMLWIGLSLIYGIINAIYVMFNEKHHFNGYVLGIWRGFGIAFALAPLLLTVPVNTSFSYYTILILQGLMIGVYDSHIFFSSSRYGSHASSGFMATCVLITTFLWWSIDFKDLAALMQTPPKLISIMLALCGFSISYWQMMKVHLNSRAEKYLYPATFALALMSIATRYIALNGGSAYAGVVYYLTVSCFVSGCYNTIMFIKEKTPARINKLKLLTAPVAHWQGAWLILFSAILITAKTLALRLAANPGYVVAVLMLSPLFAEVIKTRQLKITPPVVVMLCFLGALLILVG